MLKVVHKKKDADESVRQLWEQLKAKWDMQKSLKKQKTVKSKTNA